MDQLELAESALLIGLTDRLLVGRRGSVGYGSETMQHLTTSLRGTRGRMPIGTARQYTEAVTVWHLLENCLARPLASCLAAFWLLALADCSYVPPNQADLTRPTYQSDLAACEESGNKEAHRRVMAFGGLWFSYPISLPIEEWRQVRNCMKGKGYVASS